MPRNLDPTPKADPAAEPTNTKGKSAPRGDPAAAHEEPKRPLRMHTELNLDLPQCYTQCYNLAVTPG